MADFSHTASDYQRRAIVQQSAGEALLDMLAVAPGENVLDLACGPGALTARIRKLTHGRVTGCDAASGMIDEARRQHGDAGIEFVEYDAAALPFEGEFDAIYCNSAFQWFTDPAAVLTGCLKALRQGGRMAMQAPAKADFCPGFIQAVEVLREHAETRDTFARYQSPWLFLENAENYARLFTDAGFAVAESRMETTTNRCSPEKSMEIFNSGAAVAYLNPQCYEGGVPPDYPARAAAIIAAALRRQRGPDGQVSLAFHRIYLLARKNAG
ncbi:MAG TPA: methyltransferase domain-containing protein [Sulfuricella sp.]|nr:methyltransferase domain-containing protein [Sulfuricella sp.]